MSEKIVTLNEEVIKGQLKELVRGSCRTTIQIGEEITKTEVKNEPSCGIVEIARNNIRKRGHSSWKE